MHVVEFDQINQLAALSPVDGTQKGRWVFGNFGSISNEAQSRDAIASGTAPDEVVARYNELRERMDPQVQELSAMMPSAKRTRRYGIEGSELCTERVMVHDTDVWERRVRGAKKQTVRIAIGFGYCAGTGVGAFAESAARGVALTDVLTTLGHTVELSAFTAWHDDSDHYATIGTLKPSNQPVDPQQLLITALPSLFRWHQFAQWEAYEDSDRNAQNGHSKYEDVMNQGYVDHFGIDVYIKEADFRFIGNDESPIADSVAQITSALWENL